MAKETSPLELRARIVATAPNFPDFTLYLQALCDSVADIRTPMADGLDRGSVVKALENAIDSLRRLNKNIVQKSPSVVGDRNPYR